MTASLHLLVCKHYVREARAILRDEGITDVTVAGYPDICAQPRADRLAALERLFQESGGNGRTVILVGACYLISRGVGALMEDAFHRIHRESLCFHMLLNKTTVESYLRAGAHLVTAGWLEDWRQHIEDWQFDRDTARAFFAEGARRMVLLETGVAPEAETQLRECAAFLGLPAETVPVGLDHFRLVLTRLIQAWRTEEAQRQSKAATDQANRKLADYVMAMDLLVNLTRIMTEDDAIQAILELFTMLFGADRVAYVSAGEDALGAIRASRTAPDDAVWTRDWIGRLGAGDPHASTGVGFCVRIKHQNETLGFVIADGIAEPAREREYVNLALNIVSLCGLAMMNARSISQRQRAEQELLQKSEELARSNADLDQFAHVASHDLQAPLRHIMSFGDLLREECASALNDTGRDYLDRMQAQTRRMRRLIEGLLAFARVKTRGHPFAAVALSDPVRLALDDLAPRLEETGATVEVGELPTVSGDELQLYELCQNLIGNALKYVAKGTVPQVRLSARPANDGMAEIVIQDNGIGFEAKDRERIFQPFQRLHTEKEYPGSGIGLAVCQKIVERHGGRIWAESVPGEGTAFHFTVKTTGE